MTLARSNLLTPTPVLSATSCWESAFLSTHTSAAAGQPWKTAAGLAPGRSWRSDLTRSETASGSRYISPSAPFCHLAPRIKRRCVATSVAPVDIHTLLTCGWGCEVGSVRAVCWFSLWFSLRFSTSTHRAFPVVLHLRERSGALADPVGVVPHAGSVARRVVEPLAFPEPVVPFGHLRVLRTGMAGVSHGGDVVLESWPYRLFPVLLHFREGSGALSNTVHSPHAVLSHIVLLRLRVVLVALLARPQ